VNIRQAFEAALQHHQSGRLSEAEALYRQILAASPDHIGALQYFGVLAYQVGRSELALELIRRSLVLEPNDARAHYHLADVYRVLQRHDEAITSFRQALALEPNFPDAYNNLGLALSAQGYSEDATGAFRRAIELRPGYALAHFNLGATLAAAGHADAAIAAYRRAIALRPDEPDFHWNLALSLLPAGQWEEGWQEYEWRVRRPHLARPDLTAPPWNGGDITGRTLLIHQEGGFGDVLHFIRYLPMVLARGPARILFEGGAPILSLMKMQPGIAETIERGRPLPAHDFHCPLPSLPRLFQTNLQNIPARVPYLVIDPEMQSSWRRKLSGAPDQSGTRRPLLVGLNWAGSAQPADYRSRRLDTFASLARVPNVTFVSLQKGEESGQSAKAPPGLRIIDAAAEVEGFLELAALVSCLDAVATVDTAVAHLAGALAIPTWILLPTLPDFRWMHGREDSPWYPTVRLFRQQDAHSWAPPIEQMVALLQSKAESALRSG